MDLILSVLAALALVGLIVVGRRIRQESPAMTDKDVTAIGR